MRRLNKMPSNVRLLATRGDSRLYIYDDQTPENVQALGVLVNPTTNMIAEVPVQSALSRGYWNVTSEAKKKQN